MKLYFENNNKLNEAYSASEILGAIAKNLVREGFEEVDSLNPYRTSSYGGDDVFTRLGNSIAFLTNSQLGYAEVYISPRKMYSMLWNWETEGLDDEEYPSSGNKEFRSIEELKDFMDEAFFYNYHIITDEVIRMINDK